MRLGNYHGQSGFFAFVPLRLLQKCTARCTLKGRAGNSGDITPMSAQGAVEIHKHTPLKINSWNLKMMGLGSDDFLDSVGLRPVFSGEPAVNLPGERPQLDHSSFWM